MGRLSYEEDVFVYAEEGKKQVILDCGDYINNKSRVPMHKLKDQDSCIIPEFLAELMEKGPCSKEARGFDAVLIDVLLTSRLIRTSQPVRVLEYGCTGGSFSWYLAAVLGTFCERSSLVCASDRMDPEWMEQIAQVEKLPRVSFLAGDYGCLQLQRNCFDVVFINGTVNFEDPCKVISDASGLVSNDGFLICYTDHTPLLESAFQLFYTRNENYEIASGIRLMSAEAKDKGWTDWDEAVVSDLVGRAQEHLAQAEGILLKAGTDREQIAALLEHLKQDAETAAALGKVELKIQLMEQKGRLLDYALGLAR